MNKKSILSFLVASALLAPSITYASDSAYVRFPAIQGDTIIFTSEGDLWKAKGDGGPAQRLTTHLGTESHAAISKDGKWIAFSAQYEGGQEAYVMPVNGGKPKRISFDNTAVTVLGWTAQGEVLITRQHQQGPAVQTIIASIEIDTFKQSVFPVLDANEAALSDNGKTLFFTRMGLHTRNDNAKAYRGGAYAQLWKIELDGKSEAKQLFKDEKNNNRRPMLWKNRIYFLNDKDGAYNIYSSTLEGNEVRKLTKHKQWEVRNASIGDGKITYQLGADLRVIDLSAGNDKEIKVDLISDFDQSRQRQIGTPLQFLTNTMPASKDEKIIFTARGKISIAGTGMQRRVDINLPHDARARGAIFSHDDRFIYAFVDASGENEIWKFAANGSGKGEMLTSNGSTHRLEMFPSLDGKWLAHTDKRGRLWLLNLETKSNEIIDDAAKLGMGTHDEIMWSQDSKTIALVRGNSSPGRSQIGLYDIASKNTQFVTSDRYDSFSPTFSPDGKWLYFLSNRHFQATNGAPWGDRNMGPHFDKRTGIFAIALQKGNRFPFQADDELSKTKDVSESQTESKLTDKTEAKTDVQIAAKEIKKPATPSIQYIDLESRLFQVPQSSGNYQKLTVDDKRLYFQEQDANDRTKSVIKTLAISKISPQAEIFTANVRDYALSLDKKRMYFRTSSSNGAGDFYITEVGAKANADLSKAKVKIEDWSFHLDPQLEWQQMFLDAWRMHRDFLFDDKMRGVEWDKIKEKHLPLVARVKDRTELNDVLGLMVSELSVLHSQVRTGEIRRANPEGSIATLGAILSPTKQGARIDYIYQNEPELPLQRSPLDHPSLDIKEGDVIISVNGRMVKEARDISDLLLNQADKQVLLQVQRGESASKNWIVTPINGQKNSELRYADWERKLSQKVDKESKGQIGYLHLKAMGANDIASFARDFYANYHRDGLIIDVRRNNGGNIDSWIIEKLLRKAWAFWASAGNQPFANMQQTFRGHLVVLVDELTYSDGETFAAGVQSLKLGPLIGKRTAGAGVWLSDRNSLSDNGMVRAAENAQFDVNDGRWLVEGVGVTPDIEVDNLPHASFKGEDKQLETAIQYLKEKLKTQPIKPLKPQALPALN